jgi:hypothetical protein
MIELYLCPVCVKLCKQNREICEDFEFGKAEWIFTCDCPECSQNFSESVGMLMQDKYGACCAITDCEFEQEYKKARQ